MTTLSDRLRDLADDAADPARARTTASAPDLWGRGVREHRVSRAGVAVIVALAVVGLGATLTTWRVREAAPPAPAAPGAPVVLPDEIFRPSRWLPGTDELGPPGRLSVVMPAVRRSWRGERPGVVGISATTQEYRFLDLPDYEGGAVVLSPDGRWVAWWATGTPSGTVVWNTDTPVTGYAVYDVETGEVRRREIETVHGLNEGDLVWVDDDRLLASYGQWQVGRDAPVGKQGLAIDQRFETWRLREAPVVLGRGTSWSFVSTPREGRAVMAGDEEALTLLVDATTGRTLAEIESGRYPSRDGVAVSPGGRRYAVQPGSAIPASVAVGRVGRGRTDRIRVPGTKDVYGVLGWADDATLMLVEGEPHLGDRAVLVRVELDGRRVGEIRLPDGLWQQVSIAADLLDAPIVPAREPASPMDPRLVVGLSGGIVVAAAVLLVLWWRRRVRLG